MRTLSRVFFVTAVALITVVGFAVLLVAGCAAPRIVPVLRVLTRSFAVERDGTTSPGA